MEAIKNTETVLTGDAILTDDMLKASQLLKTYERANSLKKMKNEIKQRSEAAFNKGNSEMASKLEEAVKDLTVEQIEILSIEKIDEIYETAAGKGKDIDFSIDFQGDVNRENEFKRGFLAFIREQAIASEEMDKTINELDAILEEGQSELDRILSEYGNYGELVLASLKERLDTAEGETKVKIEKMISAFEESYKLTSLVEYVQKYSKANIIEDYKHRSDDVFTRYMRAVSKLGVKVDITKFSDLEAKFLGEEYNKYPNMFLFIVIRMYSYKKNPEGATDGVFLTQLMDNVRMLFADSFVNEEKKETFLTSIKTVLDTFLAK